MSLLTKRAGEQSFQELEHQAKLNLQQRLETSESYNQKEIDSVSNFQHRLVPAGLLLEEKSLEELRALASLSRIRLKPPSQISSHRPVIGKLIVAVKKATWPLVNFHLKDTIEAMEEFSGRMVASHSKALSRIKELEEAKQNKS